MDDNQPENNPDWRRLYWLLSRYLDKYGRESPMGEGDYWIVDEPYPSDQKVILTSWAMLTQEILIGMLAILLRFPGRRIVVQFETPEVIDCNEKMILILEGRTIHERWNRKYLPVDLRDINLQASL